MKKSSKIILIIYAFITVGLAGWFVRNTMLPEEPKISLEAKVVSKFEQNHLKQHKDYAETEGIDNYLRIYNDQYGYTDILVSITTYMNSEIGQTVTFSLTKEKMDSLYNTNFSQYLYLKSPIFVCIIFLIISLVIIIITGTNELNLI